MFQIESFKIICTDSTEIMFSKLRSAGLKYHLSKRKFFITVRGVSNKHCLLTFFILLRCASGAVKSDFRTYSGRCTSSNGNFE